MYIFITATSSDVSSASYMLNGNHPHTLHCYEHHSALQESMPIFKYCYCFQACLYLTILHPNFKHGLKFENLEKKRKELQ